MKVIDSSNSSTRHAFQSARAFVENALKRTCQQLALKLGDIHVAARINAAAANRRCTVASWLNSLLESLHLPDRPSEKELGEYLSDGSILCQIMNKVNPGSIPNIIPFRKSEGAAHSDHERLENIRNFLLALHDLRLPTFEVSDLEQGSMVAIVDCLLYLQEYYDLANNQASHYKLAAESPGLNGTRKSPSKDYRRGKVGSEQTSDVGSLLSNSVMSDSSPVWIRHIVQELYEVILAKAMPHTDIQEVEISRSIQYLDNSLSNLLSAIVGDKQQGEVPSLVQFVLRKVMEEFEFCILRQAEHIKELKHVLREVITQKDKSVSRANRLEDLTASSAEEIKIFSELLRKIKMEKMQVEKEREENEQDIIRLVKESEALQSQLDTMKETNHHHLQQLELQKREIESELKKKMKDLQDWSIKERETETLQLQKGEVEAELQKKIKEIKAELIKEKAERENVVQVLNAELESQKGEVKLELQKKIEENQDRRLKERVESEATICALKAQLETMKKNNQEQVPRVQSEKTEVELFSHKKIEETQDRHMKERLEIEAGIGALKTELETTRRNNREQLKSEKREVELELQRKIKGTKDVLSQQESKNNELEVKSAMDLQNLRLRYSCFQKLLSDHVPVLREMGEVSQPSNEEISVLKKQLNGLARAATNYTNIAAENRQLYNKVQDLNGNIRVYCRVRPLLPGDSGKQSTIEFTGENGELLINNPNKQGKELKKTFKFNKVFDHTASQEEVFRDTQPLIRSVLDGYNVCIFAYGQTGSGKTYTMTGPNTSSKEDWGVNYRALNDLFEISQRRKESIRYEIGVQMIEIYNEQVRDLLRDDGWQKKLGIQSTSQPNGLSVPDATMSYVELMNDVLDLMIIGRRNRAVGATAVNEHSSRSHSVMTVHVKGIELSSGAILRGCLNLVDLAGSERVDKSEVTGDRLKEALHINKSLSALGDVIFALANKSAHVPYRNSKLTHILQDSLGGQAKTVMFVQLNPGIESYLETISTLKFAERVSSVELGAARSNKESNEIRELKEQISKLKNVIAKKDAEFKGLQKLKP